MSSKGIEANPIKFNKITNFPTPTSIDDVKSFLGLVNYLAMFDFVPGLADQSTTLTALTKKRTVFKWEKEHQSAFEMIKRLARSVRFLQ